MNWRSLGDSNPCFRRERAKLIVPAALAPASTRPHVWPARASVHGRAAPHSCWARAVDRRTDSSRSRPHGNLTLPAGGGPLRQLNPGADRPGPPPIGIQWRCSRPRHGPVRGASRGMHRPNGALGRSVKATRSSACQIGLFIIAPRVVSDAGVAVVNGRMRSVQCRAAHNEK